MLLFCTYIYRYPPPMLIHIMEMYYACEKYTPSADITQQYMYNIHIVDIKRN
jgi:hypothetical protein